MLILEWLAGLHRSIQLQLLQHYIDLDYHDTEWFALEMNRDHSVISQRVYKIQHFPNVFHHRTFPRKHVGKLKKIIYGIITGFLRVTWQWAKWDHWLLHPPNKVRGFSWSQLPSRLLNSSRFQHVCWTTITRAQIFILCLPWHFHAHSMERKIDTGWSWCFQLHPTQACLFIG